MLILIAFLGQFLMDSCHSLIMDQQPSFVPMDVLRNAQPSTLCSSDAKSRLAKDEAYATAILNAWKEECVQRSNSEKPIDNIGTPWKYRRRSDGADLYGYIVSPSKTNEAAKLPGILLFHTAAGPQDVFLRWKADSLIQTLGCVVFIADLLSDETGYCWTDKERYTATREALLHPGKHNRPLLRETIQASLLELQNYHLVSSDRIAALGWCLGGHPILELGLMQDPAIKALISYHGVFRGAVINEKSTESNINDGTSNKCQVLICHGADDPFVDDADVEMVKEALITHCGCQVNVLNFQGVRHGFTNPAQDWHPNREAFGFDKNAAQVSWKETIQILKDAFS